MEEIWHNLEFKNGGFLMRILIVGGGGREHALLWKIYHSEGNKEIFCAPGNAGMQEIADCVDIHPTSIIELADFAQSLSIDLTVVGPELPLSLGIVDEFQKRGLSIFGPTQAATQIESSKAWAREFMNKYNIPSPKYEIVFNKKEGRDVISKWGNEFPIVLKVDGLAAGKGTIIVNNISQAEEFFEKTFEEKFYGTAGEKVIIEEYLQGIELSFQVLSDGYRVLPLATSQDYKRQLDNDLGPNTGGMGAYSPSVYLNLDNHQLIMNSIILPAIKGMEKEGRIYKGVLYAGIMLTKDGPKVLEFNARFGDPETQAIIPRLQGNFIECLQAVIEERLQDIKLEWKKEASICVVLASKGYPDSYEINKEIIGLKRLENLDNVYFFHAGTKKEDNKILTSGGRVLSIVSTATTLSAAYNKVYDAISLVNFEGMFYRKDIALKAIEFLKSKS